MARRHVRSRTDGQTFVHDRHAVFRHDLITDIHQITGVLFNLVDDATAHDVHVLMAAVQQIDAHGDGSHVQIVLLDHADRADDLIGSHHVISSPDV